MPSLDKDLHEPGLTVVEGLVEFLEFVDRESMRHEELAAPASAVMWNKAASASVRRTWNKLLTHSLIMSMISSQ